MLNSLDDKLLGLTFESSLRTETTSDSTLFPQATGTVSGSRNDSINAWFTPLPSFLPSFLLLSTITLYPPVIAISNFQTKMLRIPPSHPDHVLQFKKDLHILSSDPQDSPVRWGTRELFISIIQNKVTEDPRKRWPNFSALPPLLYFRSCMSFPHSSAIK